MTVWKDGLGDMRTVTCGSQYLSQNSRRLHFGLGSTSVVDSIVVDWPSGNQTVHDDLGTNLAYQLHENGGSGFAVGFGCTYSLACNYSEAATEENGTCDFSCTCGQGTIWDDSLNQCTPICTADHNGDGEIGTGDLILFLTYFGETCD